MNTIEHKIVRCYADTKALETIPLEQRDIPSTTYEALKRGEAINPDAPALSFFVAPGLYQHPHVWSYCQLLEKITQTANMLRRLGIGRDDVVAFILPNLPETQYVIWGGETAGITFAINPMLESEHISHLLSAAKTKWLVTLAPDQDADLWQKVQDACVDTPNLQGILTVGFSQYLPGGVISSKGETNNAALNTKFEILDLQTEIAKENGKTLDFELPKADDISSYFCTGGTTGLPKIAMRSHFSEVYDAWALQLINGFLFSSGFTMFCGLPLFHVNAQLLTGLVPWSYGAHVVLGTPAGYRTDGLIGNFWQIADHYNINGFSGVPTVYAGLMQAPVTNNNISSIKFAMCGAAPMPKELFKAFQKKFGIQIIEGYGMTEGACASSVNPTIGEPRIGSIGLRLPYQKMRTVILNDNDEFERFSNLNEIGVLAINGPNVFSGYKEASHNQGIWIEIEGGKWFNSGDLARQDEDGFFWLTGRKKELIIRSGHNIDPKLIEEPMHKHPAIALAAAIAKPDLIAGELPVLYVELVPEQNISVEELLSYAKQHISERAAVPKDIKILAKMPVTPVGKIFKPALKIMEIEAVVKQEAKKLNVKLQILEVIQHRELGLLARISASENIDVLAESLGRYTFECEIV
jgi:fatty-acyl-CoA synthase